MKNEIKDNTLKKKIFLKNSKNFEHELGLNKSQAI